jgi:hypothetical protein
MGVTWAGLAQGEVVKIIGFHLGFNLNLEEIVLPEGKCCEQFKIVN